MDCDINTVYQLIRNLPPVMFEPVLQAMIINCYLKYIDTLWTTGQKHTDYSIECEAHDTGCISKMLTGGIFNQLDFILPCTDQKPISSDV